VSLHSQGQTRCPSVDVRRSAGFCFHPVAPNLRGGKTPSFDHSALLNVGPRIFFVPSPPLPLSRQNHNSILPQTRKVFFSPGSRPFSLDSLPAPLQFTPRMCSGKFPFASAFLSPCLGGCLTCLLSPRIHSKNWRNLLCFSRFLPAAMSDVLRHRTDAQLP